MTHKRYVAWVYRLSFFMLLLTGFAQMPIFKRYYIADIPGLGWLAQFYVTHLIHYIFAVVFIVWAFYASALYLMEHRGDFRRSLFLIVRTVFFSGIMATGFLLVIRNFPGYHFAQGTIIALDVAHLGLSVAYLLVAFGFFLVRKRINR